ncbi:MAG: hypothetical protein ABJA35_11255 [Parafilimonas sp.]
MHDKYSDKSQFQINVNGKTYKVTAYANEGRASNFKIETDCEYLFTLCNIEKGKWQVEKDVTMLDESLIEQMGRAIEEYNAS